MAFQPDKIKKDHILKAIQKIDNGEVEIKKSTGYDVVYKNKLYPPKEVMRLAHQEATGQYLWNKNGGESTNKYLRELGFDINDKKSKKSKYQNLNYWIFQGNPKVFDFESALQDKTLNNFTVSAHKDKIKFGDKVIIWITGKEAGCYALAEVTTAPKKVESSADDEHWKIDDPNDIKAGINITHNLYENPLRWDNIKDKEAFANFKAGNQGTNFSATKKEYETLLNMAENNRYSWVKTHKQLSQFLLDKENKQQELIEILSSAGATLFNDQNPIGNTIPLEEIDPFTFYCYIYKYGSETRLEILQNIARELDLFVPDDDSGIPSTNAQKVWLFPYKHDRTNNEISRLWDLFYSALNNTLTDDIIADALQIKGVGKTKLTEALFYADPENYFPINGPTKPFLQSEFNINPDFKDYSGYIDILSQLREKSSKPFYQLSYEAWQWNDNAGNDELEFKKRIKNFDFKSLVIYFQNLDRLISDLNIQDDDKAVFSTSSNQLSFQIGKRYCLNLKKNKFYFITRPGYEIKNITKGEFSEPRAYYYKNASSNVIDVHYKAIAEAIKFEIDRNSNTHEKEYDNTAFRQAVFDKEYRSKFFDMDEFKTILMKEKDSSLNKILFGPPGTGKTFTTINEALKIVDPEYYFPNKDNRSALNERFKELLIKDWDKTNGQIAFCTFHQSFSYEDFVEGIKPKVNEKKDVYYEIEDGVFKRICELAGSSISAVKMKKEGKLSWDEETFRKAAFYKLSLGDSTKSEDKAIYDYCIENNVIAIGFGGDNDFSELSEGQITEKCEELKLESNAAQSLNYFIHYIKKDNYVVIGNGNKYVRALAKVVGNYEYDSTTTISYNHFRKVEWVFKDENIPIEEIYNRGLSQQTIYKLDENGIKKDFFVNQGQFFEPEARKIKNYVLIIDEINRGNVSSIFGELITLIEPDKRAGRDEELEVTLPYSKEPFKVPHNVYIIGTMNTADKSIESLDTALRRRFSFTEMPPKPNLIKNEALSGTVNGEVDGVDLTKLLETINKRIEKLIDKDHKIGHSYFLKVHDKVSLVNCFKNEVIPLLEEYFYGDYGKIGLVLGNSFVVKEENDSFEFAEFEGYDPDVTSDLKERSVYKISKPANWNFKAI